MKKMVVVVMLLAVLSACAFAETYPSGWYSLSTEDGVELSLFFLPDGCSVSLPDSASLSPLETLRPFTAAPGIYTAPNDIPSGTYSVRCAESSSWCVVTVRDDAGKLVLSQSMEVGDGSRLGSVPILDGYTVKVENGNARFEAASGIVFDSASVSAPDESADRLAVPKPTSSLLGAAQSAVGSDSSDGDD